MNIKVPIHIYDRLSMLLMLICRCAGDRNIIQLMGFRGSLFLCTYARDAHKQGLARKGGNQGIFGADVPNRDRYSSGMGLRAKRHCPRSLETYVNKECTGKTRKYEINQFQFTIASLLVNKKFYTTTEEDMHLCTPGYPHPAHEGRV